jgi:mono/diheme cytochrome c family protein
MQKRKLVTSFIMMISGMMLFVSCTSELIKPEPVSKPASNLSYSADIQPIFTSKCLGCHGIGMTAPDLSAANSYSSLTAMGLINTASPTKSTVYIEMSTGTMSAYCTPTDAANVLAWIQQGAKNN